MYGLTSTDRFRVGDLKVGATLTPIVSDSGSLRRDVRGSRGSAKSWNWDDSKLFMMDSTREWKRDNRMLLALEEWVMESSWRRGRNRERRRMLTCLQINSKIIRLLKSLRLIMGLIRCKIWSLGWLLSDICLTLLLKSYSREELNRNKWNKFKTNNRFNPNNKMCQSCSMLLMKNQMN